MARIEGRLFTQVGSYSNETYDYTVPNGAILRLDEIGGSAGMSNELKIEVIWDALGAPEIISATHGCINNQHTLKEFTGDGSKILRIKLTNDTSSSETIGAYWIGFLDNG